MSSPGRRLTIEPTKTVMTQETMRQFQRALKEKRLALRKALGHRDEISIVRSADALDALQLSQERSLAIEHLDLNTQVLRQVEIALDRLDKGDYGTCMHCEAPIPEKRLRAIPWAVLCVSCQEKEERLPPRRSASVLEEAA